MTQDTTSAEAAEKPVSGALGCLVVVAAVVALIVLGIVWMLHSNSSRNQRVQAACHTALEQKLPSDPQRQVLWGSDETSVQRNMSGYGITGTAVDTGGQKWSYVCSATDGGQVVQTEIHEFIPRQTR